MANSDDRPTNPGPEGEHPAAPGHGPAGETSGAAPPEARSSGEATHTRTAGTWAAVVVATIALIVLLVFILQNLQPAAVTFFGVRANLPLGVALLFAAAIGGLLVIFAGAARILQLRRTAHRQRKQKRAKASG